jgi:NADPH:quinone reductase-like Zn-dependent oxidoreductase
MKAAIRSRYGSPDVLSIREVTKPVPEDNELLIKVYATTVNRTDCAILSAKPFPMRFFTGLFKPKLETTGTDFAGVVEATGKKVTTFKAGDRVWGFNGFGLRSHAEYITLPANDPVIRIPDGIAYETAAASAEGAFYAWSFIKRLDIKPGQHALIYGASGAIGSAAVQLFKYLGVAVTAVCDTKNLALMKSIGADRVLDYTKEDFTKDSHGYRFIMDAVGKCRFKQCKPLLLKGGIYTSTEGIELFYLPLLTRLYGDKKVIFGFPDKPKAALAFIGSLLEKRQFHPVIDRRYPLEEIADVFRYVASGQKTGNVILTINDD